MGVAGLAGLQGIPGTHRHPSEVTEVGRQVPGSLLAKFQESKLAVQGHSQD